MSKKSKQIKLHKLELNKAMEEVSGIRLSLSDAYYFFNSTSDPELTEACIYEINALRARYDYTLRRVKQTARLL